jgi:hypothetical protein
MRGLVVAPEKPVRHRADAERIGSSARLLEKDERDLGFMYMLLEFV